MALAPATVRCMPDNVRRWPMTALHPDSTTPEPANRPRERNHLQRMRGAWCSKQPRAAFSARRHGGRISAGYGPGLADLLADLHDLLTQGRELRVPLQLPPHFGHFRRGQLPALGLLPPHRPGPQEPGPVPGMIRLRARAIRLPALPVVLRHRPAAEVTDLAELRIQPFPLGLQFRKRGPGHGYSSSDCGNNNQTPIITSPDAGPLHSCRTPRPTGPGGSAAAAGTGAAGLPGSLDSPA